eukprot:CAMPEP_0185498502 /NCGR_PEP_ID=MMETSP1366-20130426/19722_1 /TAXON_ID=38817 /ORGANISM="Gephyrocapsa oceanica, Strain RCC1303" /LENGTH=237 /DNA_ID=CAMNT_0028107665 /DNA_START=206 /DNA_END=920 /DNA_ORIENTATION=+
MRWLGLQRSQGQGEGTVVEDRGVVAVWWCLLVYLDDGALDAYAAAVGGRRVEDEDGVVGEVVHHVLCAGRAHVPEPVRRRRRHWHCGALQQLARQRMLRHPHADVAAARGDGGGELGHRGRDQRERPRPEARGQPAHQLQPGRPEPHQSLGRAGARHVHDEGVGARPPLDREYARDRRLVEGVGAQPVHSLSREGNQPPAAESARRLVERVDEPAGPRSRRRSGHRARRGRAQGGRE